MHRRSHDGIVEATKETKVQGTMLTTPYGDAVSVNTNKISIPVAALAFMPAEVASNLDTIGFGSVDLHDIVLQTPLKSGERHY